MDTRDCAKCGDLWKAYARTTTRHIALVNDQRTAYTNRDYQRASQLEAEINEAGQQRQAAGDAIQLHEIERHQGFAGRVASVSSRRAGQL